MVNNEVQFYEGEGQVLLPEEDDRLVPNVVQGGEDLQQDGQQRGAVLRGRQLRRHRAQIALGQSGELLPLAHHSQELPRGGLCLGCQGRPLLLQAVPVPPLRRPPADRQQIILPGRFSRRDVEQRGQRGATADPVRGGQDWRELLWEAATALHEHKGGHSYGGLAQGGANLLHRVGSLWRSLCSCVRVHASQGNHVRLEGGTCVRLWDGTSQLCHVQPPVNSPYDRRFRQPARQDRDVGCGEEKHGVHIRRPRQHLHQLVSGWTEVSDDHNSAALEGEQRIQGLALLRSSPARESVWHRRRAVGGRLAGETCGSRFYDHEADGARHRPKSAGRCKASVSSTWCSWNPVNVQAARRRGGATESEEQRARGVEQVCSEEQEEEGGSEGS